MYNIVFNAMVSKLPDLIIVGNVASKNLKLFCIQIALDN